MHDLINLSDSYKFSHSSQYPLDTVALHEYMEARKSPYDEIVWVGLTYYISMLTQPVTVHQVSKAHNQAIKHGIPFDLAGWLYIAKELKGYLPIHIRALPEGSIVKPGVPLMTVTSTDENVPWVAGFVETLLMKVWYPTTVASKARHVRKILEKFVSPQEANFMYHNFGDRGSSSVESAFLGSLGHLTQFFGTDNFNSLHVLQDFYNDKKDIPAFSVYATEHSTTTAYGRYGEAEFIKTQIEDNRHRPILSFVADSYDVYKFTDMITSGELAEIIKQPNMPMITIRPDSGNPLEVLPKMYEIMMKSDATTGVNDGLALFTNYRILWGDGITPETIEEILKQAIQLGLAPQNFVFGSGGDIMQNVNRDTLGFAMKCSNITLSDGEDIAIYKDPITDPGKKSKRGKVTTYGGTESQPLYAGVVGDQPTDAMIDVYKNGNQIYYPNFNAIRERSGNSL